MKIEDANEYLKNNKKNAMVQNIGGKSFLFIKNDDIVCTKELKQLNVDELNFHLGDNHVL